MNRYELVCGDMALFLKMLTAQNVSISHIRYKDAISASFQAENRYDGIIQSTVRRCGASLTVTRPKGLCYYLRYFGILIAGFLCLTVLVLFLPGRILFVRVEGNQRLEEKLILEQAELSGITFGASRKHVRSEKTKNQLLSRIPSLSWVGVNTHGVVAVISVEERSDSGGVHASKLCSTITAKCDGLIVDVSATAGRALCKSGEVVQKGQTLISGISTVGKLPVIGAAEGEILAQTVHHLDAVVLPAAVTMGGKAATENAYGFIINKKKILFSKNSGKMNVRCGTIKVDKYLQLPGGFVLPIGICVITKTEMTEESRIADTTWAKAYLSEYLTQHMVSGRILSACYTEQKQEGCCIYHADFACTEDIGVMVSEEME